MPPPYCDFSWDCFVPLSPSSVSLCSDITHYDGGLQIDEGCVRLATANALLKLAKSQENPVSADVYLQLALTMQASLAASLNSLVCTLKTFIRQPAHVKLERVRSILFDAKAFHECFCLSHYIMLKGSGILNRSTFNLERERNQT